MDGITYLQLQQCPSCEYSLQGLPSAGNCPECGFTYDEQTIELTGISRGISTLSPMRRIMWIIVGIGAAFGPMPLMLILLGQTPFQIPLFIIATLWLCIIVYLLITGKSERKGMEKFLFTAGGFGPSHITPYQINTIEFTSWSQANEVRVQRKGATWYRVQIGCCDRPGGKFRTVVLDAGMRLDQDSAKEFEVFANKCIATAVHF